MVLSGLYVKKRKQEQEDKVYGDNGKVTHDGMITVSLRQMQKLRSKISVNTSRNAGRRTSIGSGRTM